MPPVGFDRHLMLKMMLRGARVKPLATGNILNLSKPLSYSRVALKNGERLFDTKKETQRRRGAESAHPVSFVFSDILRISVSFASQF